MEPDFVRQQVHNVWRVLSANAKLVQDRRLTIEGAFVDTEFVVDQAVLLYEAVVDSVNIYMGNIRGQNRDLPFLIMRPDFLSQQAEMLKAVIDDSVRLQDMSKTSFSDLTSLGDTFVLNMVNNIRDVVTDVASAAGPSTVPVAKLSIARPLYVQKLALSFQCVMNAYLLQRRGVVILHEKLQPCGKSANSAKPVHNRQQKPHKAGSPSSNKSLRYSARSTCAALHRPIRKNQSWMH
ncbi:hypothetical protein C8Q70DRAFT_50845 [Cubamyces menziesii]|nr:hypothetical protein C8Q70DRAFT_50845 [Cubamyces menziesii]